MLEQLLKYSWLIPLLPLMGAIISGMALPRSLRKHAHWPIWLSVFASAAISVAILVAMWGQLPAGDPSADPANLAAAVQGFASPAATNPGVVAFSHDWFTWIEAGAFKASAGFLIDPLSAVMLVVVTGVGFLITVFAKGYMHGEEGYARFFSYLGLFIFAMTILVMGNNLLLLYLGWEGVGVCSYLLIGYYYNRPSARDAARKAFIVNRVGDFGFGLGVMLVFLVFGSVSYFGSAAEPGALAQAVNPSFLGSLSSWKSSAISWIPFLLMVGAFGKSAQFPLYVWLPDAMEGPTPVSALIHAATMVTAGIYMIARCSALFMGVESAMLTIGIIGCFTAVFAGFIATRQFDLKKVFAYSTVSQLGFMFAGVSFLAPVAAVFHLVTHAFFKALLFLSSGVVMHATGGELDMRKMSGLKRKLPMTRWFMLVGCLALAGVAPLAGFWSKDEIISAALRHNPLPAIVLLLTAAMTAYYTFRLYFRVFEGPEVMPHPQESHGHASHGEHHSPETPSMMVPLAILALGAILAGLVNFPHPHLARFLGFSPSLVAGHAALTQSWLPEGEAMAFGQVAGHELNLVVMAGSVVVALLGIAIAWAVHLFDRGQGQVFADKLAPLCRVLDAKFWVDEVYQALLVDNLRRAGEVFYAVDRIIIDGIVGLVAFVPQVLGLTLKYGTQRGSMQGYGVLMLLGLAAILSFLLI